MLKKLGKKEVLFLLVTLGLVLYIAFFKTRLYESHVSVVVKNLSQSSANIGGLSFLIPNSSQSQDIFTIETYLKSFDELQKLDKKFKLKAHYASLQLDIVERLKPWSTKEDFLRLYQKRVEFVYDQATGIVTLGFLHTSSKKAYEILNELLKDANEKLNEYNREVAQKQLEYAEKQVQEVKNVLDESIKRLIDFQNRYVLLNPEATAQSKLTLAAKLEAELTAKKVQLQDLLQYMNKNAFEVKRLKNDIQVTKKALEKLKRSLANPKARALNIYIVEYERLKQLVEFNKELYKQALIQLEQLKMEINKNAKLLLTLTKPYLPQSYKYPEVFKETVTILLLMALFYGIVTLIQSIIKEHID